MERTLTNGNTTFSLSLDDASGQPTIALTKQTQVNEPVINTIHSVVCPDCGHVIAGGVSEDIDLEALPRTTCCQEPKVPVISTETEEEENIVTKHEQITFRLSNLSALMYMAQEISEWQMNQLVERLDNSVDSDTHQRIMEYIDRARTYISDADSCLSDAEYES